MALVDPFDNFHVPRALVQEFVAVFSRCEYAMKEGGYRRDSHGMAAPAWIRLAQEAAKSLKVATDNPLAEAISYLSKTPPRIQTFAAGWQDAPQVGGHEIEKAVMAAVQVRNNLFHGGKHYPSNGDRDERLVRAALLLIKSVIEADAQLRAEYNLGMP